MPHRHRALTAVALIALTLTGCASPPDEPPPHEPSPNASTSAAPSIPVPEPHTSGESVVGDAAVALGDQVAIHSGPAAGVVTSLANPQPSGAPLTFLVVATRGGWLQVELPLRPNGSTGWIDAASVSLHSLEYSLRASTSNNTLELYKGAQLVTTYTVATGTGGTPTPHGSFYLTELLEPTNPGYGPYAFGLSAFSEVLSDFGGGPGQIGLHGTDDAASIGHAASHGCIRMADADITALAKLLPLGTPITIE